MTSPLDRISDPIASCHDDVGPTCCVVTVCSRYYQSQVPVCNRFLALKWEDRKYSSHRRELGTSMTSYSNITLYCRKHVCSCIIVIPTVLLTNSVYIVHINSRHSHVDGSDLSFKCPFTRAIYAPIGRATCIVSDSNA